MKADMTIEEALATLRGVELDDLSQLPPELQERIPQSRVFAEAAAVKADRPRLNDMQKLMATAMKAPTAGQRVMWLQADSQALSDAHGANTACQKGCRHCCHIPVKLTQTTKKESVTASSLN